VHAGLLGGGEHLGAVLCEELLVGRDHVLAGLEGAELEVERRARPADELDDDVDLGVIDEIIPDNSSLSVNISSFIDTVSFSLTIGRTLFSSIAEIQFFIFR